MSAETIGIANQSSVYVSYLVFQLWSHTHLYQDRIAPSAKLPAAQSVRAVTSRVRKKSNNVREQLVNTHAIRKIRSGTSIHSMRTLGYSKPSKSARSAEKIGTVAEAPETTLDDDERSSVRRGPYLPRSSSGSSAGARATLVSPDGATSEVTLSNPISQPAESTVRLVSEHEHMRQDSSWSDPVSRASSPMSRIGSGEDSSFDSDDDGWRRREARGRSRTPMSEVLSAYYQDGHLMEHRGQWKEMADVDISGRPGPSPWQSSPGLSVTPPEEEMSWTLIIVLLLSVTAVSERVCFGCIYADFSRAAGGGQCGMVGGHDGSFVADYQQGVDWVDPLAHRQLHRR